MLEAPLLERLPRLRFHGGNLEAVKWASDRGFIRICDGDENESAFFMFLNRLNCFGRK